MLWRSSFSNWPALQLLSFCARTCLVEVNGKSFEIRAVLAQLHIDFEYGCEHHIEKNPCEFLHATFRPSADAHCDCRGAWSARGGDRRRSVRCPRRPLHRYGP